MGFGEDGFCSILGNASGRLMFLKYVNMLNNLSFSTGYNFETAVKTFDFFLTSRSCSCIRKMKMSLIIKWTVYGEKYSAKE